VSWLKGFGLLIWCPSLLTFKLVQRYNHKMRDNKFLKMDGNLIVKAMSSFSVPPVSFGAVPGLAVLLWSWWIVKRRT
jgi:hypothetical protein